VQPALTFEEAWDAFLWSGFEYAFLSLARGKSTQAYEHQPQTHFSCWDLRSFGVAWNCQRTAVASRSSWKQQ